MDELLHNYHTHTVRCLHARDTEEDYILAAIGAGFGTIGFSDHMPWITCPDPPKRVRMLPEEMPDYVETLRALREKYAGRIRVFIGLECEAFPEYFSRVADMKEEYALDYLLLANHYVSCNGFYYGRCSEKAHLLSYRDVALRGMESGLFAYLCHPDLCLQTYPGFDDTARGVCRDICEAAKALDLPLEYNLLGVRRLQRARDLGGLGYTTDEFWEIAAQTGNRAIVGVDAHTKDQHDCRELFLASREKLRGLGIRLIDHPDGMGR